MSILKYVYYISNWEPSADSIILSESAILYRQLKTLSV